MPSRSFYSPRFFVRLRSQWSCDAQKVCELAITFRVFCLKSGCNHVHARFVVVDAWVFQLRPVLSILHQNVGLSSRRFLYYRAIPIISPGLTELFCWAYFRWSLFLEGLVIGRNFSFQNGFGLSIKTASNNSPWAYIREGLLFFFFFFFVVGGGGGAYYRKFTVLIIRQFSVTVICVSPHTYD